MYEEAMICRSERYRREARIPEPDLSARAVTQLPGWACVASGLSIGAALAFSVVVFSL